MCIKSKSIILGGAMGLFICLWFVKMEMQNESKPSATMYSFLTITLNMGCKYLMYTEVRKCGGRDQILL